MPIVVFSLFAAGGGSLVRTYRSLSWIPIRSIQFATFPNNTWSEYVIEGAPYWHTSTRQEAGRGQRHPDKDFPWHLEMSDYSDVDAEADYFRKQDSRSGTPRYCDNYALGLE